jgi:hypothetical protein
MKKANVKKVGAQLTKKKDMSVSDLSKVMMKGFKDTDRKHDELAGMVARGFTEIHADMRGMEDRLDGRIDGVEGRLTILDHKVDRIQDSVNELSYESRKTRTRIENLEFKVFGSIQEPWQLTVPKAGSNISNI